MQNRNMELYVIVLVFITGIAAQQDLCDKAFIFPKPSPTAHVILKTEIKNPLQKVSVCLRSYTELTRKYSLFSLATRTHGEDNTILIMSNPPDSCSIYINQEENKIKIDLDILDWKHTCMTWDSDTGLLQLWINGKLYPRRVSRKGFSIHPEISVILGQEQDSFGGGFDINQSFVGEIKDVHMWNYVLSPEDIQKSIYNEYNGNVINWRALHYEIKGEVIDHMSHKNMGNNVFLFPKPTSTAHVILRPSVVKPLQKVTVCLWSYSEVTRTHSLFSLATPSKDNAFLIFPTPPSSYSMYINQENIAIKTDTEVLDWKHTCVTWDSDTGVIQLWVDGKVYPRKVISKGAVIGPETSIVLAQEQDSFGGGFDENQSFFGEISDVNMWDYVLTPEEMQKVLSNELNGNLIDWRSLNFDLKGNVIIQPKLRCKPMAYTNILYTQCRADKTTN